MPRKPSLHNLRSTLHRLNLEQKQAIYAWLGEAISQEAVAVAESSQRQTSAVMEQRHYLGKTYQLEHRRCGKAGCICRAGKLVEVGHGPYWYCYWKVNGKVRSQYLGKRPPGLVQSQ